MGTQSYTRTPTCKLIVTVSNVQINYPKDKRLSLSVVSSCKRVKRQLRPERLKLKKILATLKCKENMR